MTDKKIIVPIVIKHKPDAYGRVMYQVYVETYNSEKHEISSTNKDYDCFYSMEEVDAYIKGLEVGGIKGLEVGGVIYDR